MNALSLKWFNNTGATYNGVANNSFSAKQTLAAWGFAMPKFYPRSKGVGVFMVDVAGGDPAAAPVIPYGAPIIVYGTLVGMNSGAELIVFQGARRQWSGRAQPQARSTNMVFADAIWDLSNTPFQHYWQTKKSGDSGLVTRYFSRINLFQNITAGPTNPWTYFTIAQQIAEIITYAASNCSIPIQLGTVDPVLSLPLLGVKQISCWDALMKCVQSLPDVATLMDYTTTPPTIHFLQRTGSQAAVTLPWSGTDAHGRAHQSADLKDRPDLVPSQVVIQYQQIFTQDGLSTTFPFNDAYPLLSQGNAVQALVVPIDLSGGTLNTGTGHVTAAAINPATTAFWQSKKTDLAGAQVVFGGTPIVDTTVNGGGGHPFGITVVDQSGSPVSLASFPNELQDGDIVAAMTDGSGNPVTGQWVTITAYLNYKKRKTDNAGTNWYDVEKFDNHPVSVRLQLTNSAAGTVNYQWVTSAVQAETAPTGLAQYIYNSLRPVPWEGTHTIVENNIYEIITPASVLNLTGSSLTNQEPSPQFNSAWATMKAQIVDVEIDFFHGRTTLHFGPHKHLSADEVFDLIQMWRWRIVWPGNANLRNTGSYGGDGSVDIGGTVAKENTEHASPDASLHTVFSPVVSSQRVMIQHDANTGAGQLVMQTIDATGTPIAVGAMGLPQVLLSLQDLYDSITPTTALLAKWRVGTRPDGTTFRVAASADFDVGGGFAYRGDYNPATSYDLYDVVRKRSGGSQGVWVCVIANPTSSHQPTWPEPANSGGTNYWEMLAFGIQSTAVCQGGAKTVDINASTPY